MSVRIWRNQSPAGLLVTRTHGAASVGNGVLVLPEIQMESPDDLVVSLPGVCPKEWELGTQTNTQT